ncbi:hypothetical protein [Metapseudomonas boanensis]|uniref:Uncharacterized protein n=1 Tax=Metapseudomonas boanensis TaxID=2822138 RepID=A0ABS5XAX5_9GAMM|nr:hypothetical protein [Pseudomonas boanensis]MBT8764782.1 hypothetical protein [Pseudomonas boanensis]
MELDDRHESETLRFIRMQSLNKAVIEHRGRQYPTSCPDLSNNDRAALLRRHSDLLIPGKEWKQKGGQVANANQTRLSVPSPVYWAGLNA